MGVAGSLVVVIMEHKVQITDHHAADNGGPADDETAAADNSVTASHIVDIPEYAVEAAGPDADESDAEHGREGILTTLSSRVGLQRSLVGMTHNLLRGGQGAEPPHGERIELVGREEETIGSQPASPARSPRYDDRRPRGGFLSMTPAASVPLNPATASRTSAGSEPSIPAHSVVPQAEEPIPGPSEDETIMPPHKRPDDIPQASVQHAEDHPSSTELTVGSELGIPAHSVIPQAEEPIPGPSEDEMIMLPHKRPDDIPQASVQHTDDHPSSTELTVGSEPGIPAHSVIPQAEEPIPGPSEDEMIMLPHKRPDDIPQASVQHTKDLPAPTGPSIGMIYDTGSLGQTTEAMTPMPLAANGKQSQEVDDSPNRNEHQDSAPGASANPPPPGLIQGRLGLLQRSSLGHMLHAASQDTKGLIGHYQQPTTAEKDNAPGSGQSDTNSMDEVD